MGKKYSLITKIISFVLILGILFQNVGGSLISFADEVTDASSFSAKYYNGTSWVSFNKRVTANNINGIRLTTNNSEYYLQYQTLNNGKTGFYSAVNSNDMRDIAYAGTGDADSTQRAIQQVRIRVLKSSDNTAIHDGIVLMYRVKTEEGWLPWVSNADPEWMYSVKAKYNLDGTLDTSGSYAGKQGSDISGIEIHLYEEADISNAVSFEGREISANTSYIQNGGSAWINFSKTAETGMIDRIKIQTSENDYYLTYQTKNEGQSGFCTPVFSQSTNDYAGAGGKPIQLIRINAYSDDGDKLVAGVVVMYRVKIETGWLPWVSNANPEYMTSVQSQYGLDGRLDTKSSYAGKSGYNILGVEIRIFKGEIPNYDVDGFSGTESGPELMQYTSNGSVWNNFTSQTPITNSIRALKIHTDSGKPYYLSYSVLAEGVGGFYSAVCSHNQKGESDYAGVFTRDIQALKIKVYTTDGGASITRGVVVMYRAYTDKWLPWVSNADPEWMQSVKVKYGIEGALDTRSGYAGVIGTDIKAVEIRIFEENEVNTACKSGGKKTLQVPYIYQMNGFPTGCESVSTVMALQKAGVNMSVATFVDRYLPKDPNTKSFNPNEAFGGNPRSTSGMGCYAPAIMKALNGALTGRKQYAQNVSGMDISALCSQYIDNGIPVVMWATMEMKQARTVKYPQGLEWIAPEHCLLLVGYDDTCYIFHDPMQSAYKHFLKSDVVTAYESLGKQAIVILNGQTASTPTTPENNAPSVQPSASTQEYKKPNTAKESNYADPVDLSTGSHIIEHNIISLFAGNKTAFSINYNSSQLVSGSIGAGWYHNFEKKLEISGDNILIYDSPSVYSIYQKESDTVYNCVTKGKEKYVLTKLHDNSYVLDCNKNGKMYFSSEGRLTGTEDKQGFKTVLTHYENKITITDAISGSIDIEFCDGLINRVTDGIRTAEFEYTNGYLTSIKDVNGCMLYYTYNEEGLIETGSDDNNAVYFRNTYSDGKVVEQIDGSGDNNKTLFNYVETENGTTVTVTNRNGDNSTRVFNTDGLLTRYTDENGNVKTYTYDENRNLISKTDENGNVETIVYNEKNLAVKNIDKNGNVTSFSYDNNNNLLSIVRGNNGDVNSDGIIDIRDLVRMKLFLADSALSMRSGLDVNMDGDQNAVDLVHLRSHLLGFENIYISAETFKYNDFNQLIEFCDLSGTKTTYTYDSESLLSSKTQGDRTERYTYSDGALTKLEDANGNETIFELNSLNQIEKQISIIKKLDYVIDETQDDTGGVFDTPIISIDPVEISIEYVSKYTYDNKGNVLTFTDSENNTTSKTYDGNNLLTSETDANGNTTFYTYNGNMKLEYVTFCDGSYIFYDYDGEDRLVSVRDQNGNVSYTEYDKAGRISRTSDAAKNTVEYIRDNVGNALKTIASDGGVREFTYDANGNILTQKDTLGNITTNTYDRFNRLISTTNAVGGVTSYTYTVSGNLLKVVDPVNNITEYTYDIYGNKLSQKDPNGNVTQYAYDKNNNLITVTDALGNVTSNSYDQKNRIIQTKNPDGSIVIYNYDSKDRLVSMTDALGGVVTYTYDPSGNVLTVTDAKGNIQTSNTYDSFNRPISTTTASGNVTTNSYDLNGNLISSTDALGNKQSYVYNSLNQVSAVIDRNNSKTSVAYDSKGNVSSVSLDGSTTNYTYDTNSNLLSETTSSGGLVEYTYNALNLKQEQTNARGQTRSYSYDAAGRITGYVSPEGSATFTYDNNGNILTASDQNGTITRTFDELNRVKTYTDTLGNTISYEYDSMGRITKLVYPDNTFVTYQYDLCGNLRIVTDWAGRETKYAYDANNSIVAVLKPDGSETETTYDSANRVVYTAETVNGVVIVGYEYSYDALGRISTETDLASNIKFEYTYDSLSRVTSRKITNLSDNTTSEETYSYDANGNITSCTVSDGTNTFVYDQNNRLTSYNGQTVTYDMDGNMLSATLNGAEVSFVYDSANRLISAGGNTYTYNVEDVRVRNLCGESETTYAYNTNGRLSQLLVKTTDGVVTKYVYGLGLIGEETSGSFKTYHFDYRGSTTAITDINGNVTDTFTYDTYGNLISRTGTSVVIFLYNGRDGVVTDDNGLIYMRARYYSPELRRFINADIIAGEISNAVTLNRYAYANGNPVSNVDPFGLSAQRGNGINYHAVPRNDINGIGMLSDGTILFGINATNEDVYALILISQMTFAGESSESILSFVDRYIDSRDGNTVIKKGKLLDYYTNFQDITKSLTALMIRNEYMYTTYYSGDELKSLANIPFAWIDKLSEFKNNVQNKGIWDLKQNDDWQQSSLYYFDGKLVDSDAPGNIMYGYMGKAYGIPDSILYYAAGYAQYAADTSRQEWFYIGTGDDPIDSLNIEIGIDYYNKLHS